MKSIVLIFAIAAATLVTLAGCGDSESGSSSGASSSAASTLGQYSRETLESAVGSDAVMQQQSRTVDDMFKEVVFTRVTLFGSVYDGMLAVSYRVDATFEPLSVVSYFDHDGNVSTGCSVGGIGAEYALYGVIGLLCNDQNGTFEAHALGSKNIVASGNSVAGMADRLYGNSDVTALLADRNATVVVQFGNGNLSDSGLTFDAAYTSDRLSLEAMPDLTGLDGEGDLYGTVTSPVTGKVWMDRNLGASGVCESLDDEACFGDLYQWGRSADGHQRRDSTTTSSKASSLLPSHGDFITVSTPPFDWTTADTNATLRSTEWNPCPTGFRIPTKDEWSNESLTNAEEAFRHLKMPMAGFRWYNNGSIGSIQSGTYWSATLESMYPDIWYQYIDGNIGRINGDHAVYGRSVRCIQEFGMLTSPTTGRIWMDRNLGAQRACHGKGDEACYGDYYQWGRAADGHEKSTSTARHLTADTITPGHPYFISSDTEAASVDWTTADNNCSQRQAVWDPCPADFRLPTHDELASEHTPDGSRKTMNTIYEKLRIPFSGARSGYDGVIVESGELGYPFVHASSIEYSARYDTCFTFNIYKGIFNGSLNSGRPVRCIYKTCRDDTFGCPECGVNATLKYKTDGSGYCE